MSGPVANPASVPWAPPSIFEGYRILWRISRGGMGEVYLGHDTLLDRQVAIKFISAHEPDAWTREQFLIEARAAARLQHPNVASIYRVGEINGRPYIVSEFVRGEGLDSLITPLPWPRVVDFGRGLSHGLAAAHRGGVLHRDIKPSNAIISTTGEVKLIDFGLAEFVEANPVTVQFQVPTEAEDEVLGTEHTVAISGASLRGNAVAKPIDPAALLSTADGPLSVTADENAQPAEPAPSTRGGIVRLQAAQSPRLPSWRGASTQSNRIVGTPHYMAPEIWRGEPSTRQSDIYSTGAVLFELCVGTPPHAEVQGSYEELSAAVNGRDVPPLTALVPGVDTRFSEIVSRCLRRAPAERYASADELCDALEQLRAGSRQVAPPEGNPYRGLFAFEAEHRALFFGRSNEIGTVVDRLRSEPMVLVAADSGIGKSSLCRAGVLPLLEQGALGGNRQWQVLPLVPGRTPLVSLCAVLAPLLQTTDSELATQLRSEPMALGRALHQQLGENRGLVLFIDQLEEIVTIADPEQAAIFGQALGRLNNRLPAVRMLMTARSDFLSRIATVAGIGEDLARPLYFLRPLHAEKIHEAIVGPANAKGVRFESPALVNALVDETAKTDGGLPLLQFALTELWDTRTGDLITAESLASIGGVAGALARHADRVLLRLPPAQQLAARRILMRLVTVEGTRARRHEEELATSNAAKQAIEALVSGRLLIAHATSDGIIYEVAHEALIKGWGTLRHWLEEFAESIAVKQRLESAVAEWTRLGRSKVALWSARQLAELQILDAQDFTAKELAFIKTSQQTLARNRALRLLALLVIPLTLASFYGAIRYRHLRERNQQVATHLSRGRTLFTAAQAKSREVETLRAQAFSAFDAQRKDDGETRWASAQKAALADDALFVQASQALEAALAIDASRNDVRALLADSLFEGALAADRDRRAARRDELVQRMMLYDRDGARMRRWQAPARITFEMIPQAAQVRLAQYVEDEHQHRRLTAERDLDPAARSELALTEGSYLLSFSRPGHHPVRYPLLVRRGEALHIVVDLPMLGEIPEGFVYVPAGSFLFGTGSDESVRQGFLSTVPLHQVALGAFLIGRFEVTYGDWLDFLQHLPPAERAARTIQLPKGGIGGGVELKQLADGSWQLTLQPVTERHTMRVGEPIRYASRKLRREQNWLRLPVSGIGPEDLRAYAAWLGRSGRVQGARLCSEFEWERAARGADDREYPHGNAIDPSEANFDETYGKAPDSAGPDEVGSYPATVSPFGLHEVAGNVFEWTTSSLLPNEVALRGGGYFMGALVSRSTNRTVVDPGFRDPSVGGRLCAPFRPKR